MEFKAEFELEDEPGIVMTIYESIREELRAEEFGDKKSASVELTHTGPTLRLQISTTDVVRLRAMVNTWLRLIKIAAEMTQVVRECDPQRF